MTPGCKKIVEASYKNSLKYSSAKIGTEHILLAARALGLGALWVCDIFFAYEEVCAWLGDGHQITAVVALGYPAEDPAARPRRPLEETIVWL